MNNPGKFSEYFVNGSLSRQNDLAKYAMLGCLDIWLKADGNNFICVKKIFVAGDKLQIYNWNGRRCEETAYIYYILNDISVQPDDHPSAQLKQQRRTAGT